MTLYEQQLFALQAGCAQVHEQSSNDLSDGVFNVAKQLIKKDHHKNPNRMETLNYSVTSGKHQINIVWGRRY